ncbi:hypothetical protein Naga_100158g19 [Nannochloropsis gaditana]|uniref:Uncharacterized protein n=1 Tax=Nannochloropsis gaditana TaxID=72520 RepID=W7TSG5_9STRA|nr:hypothetical protein Naga_100158g19 [Nannochloropsis gaditana]
MKGLHGEKMTGDRWIARASFLQTVSNWNRMMRVLEDGQDAFYQHTAVLPGLFLRLLGLRLGCLVDEKNFVV